MHGYNTTKVLESTTKMKAIINVLGNFVCEPIKEYLEHWFDRLEIMSQVIIGPYNQVFQQLLIPTRKGVKFEIILIRLEDWGNKSNDMITKEVIDKNIDEFLSILIKKKDEVFRIVAIVPCSSIFDHEKSYFRKVESSISQRLDKLSNIEFITNDGFLKNFTAQYYDNHADEHAHMPFTLDMYANIATVIARKIYSYNNNKRIIKVIVLDCDNTLWAGICGEDGPLGVEISEPYRYLQNFMLDRYKKGVLLCICSKNNEEDVLEVFAKNKSMLLQEGYFVCKKINWESKAKNIIAIGKELNLGLNNFAFVDDNPVECMEVINTIPEVLTINLPYESDKIPGLLKNIWDFDLPKHSTIEDQNRTILYQNEQERECFKNKVKKLKDFINGLQLNIQILDFQDVYLSRMSQLSYRVNQFNFTNRRYSEKDIMDLMKIGYTCKIISVSDRFGDYGIVGVVIYNEKASEMEVVTFLLSCRVLGRGVEYSILSELGKIAVRKKLAKIKLYFSPTSKNHIITDFLKKIGLNGNKLHDEKMIFVLEAEKAEALSFLNYL